MPIDEDALDPSPDDLPGDPEPAEPDDDSPEPEDEPEPQEPVEPEDEPEPQEPALQRTVPRSESRIRTLAEENRRKDAELSDVRRRLDELTGRMNAPQIQQESPEQRATRLALMSPEERIREELRESTTLHQRDMQLMRFQLLENSDKASFEAKAANDPRYRKWAPKVEQELANLRARNQNVNREDLFYYLWGKASFASDKDIEKQKSAAASRVRKATTRPANTRSDSAPAARTRQSQSLEKRLENVSI